MRHSIKRLVIPFFILASLPAWSDDGRIPIWQPTTIDQPGSYYLTRDLYWQSGEPAPIVIEAANVELDLNGRTIGTTSSYANGILIQPSAADVFVHDGRLIKTGIYSIGDASNPKRLRLERLEISDYDLEAILSGFTEYVEIIDCVITDARGGVRIMGHSFQLRGRVTNNTFVRTSLELSRPSGMEIRGNLFAGFCPGCYGLISASLKLRAEGAGNSVVENVIVGTEDDGVWLRVTERGVVRDNVLVGNEFNGIIFDSGANLISGNVINDNGRDGVNVGQFAGLAPPRTLIDGNQIWKNHEFGMHCHALDPDGNASNAYRNNMLRGNILGPINDPENALTNEGGNID